MQRKENGIVMCKTKETNMLQIQKGQDIKQEVLQRYKTILPDELIKIWEDNGLATLMGGYLKFASSIIRHHILDLMYGQMRKMWSYFIRLNNRIKILNIIKNLQSKNHSKEQQQ